MDFPCFGRTARAALLAVSGLVTIMSAQSAFAQAAGAQDNAQSGIADIIVTAQRREQNLQDVPIAITAVTSEALTANRITSVQDLSALAPNFTVTKAAGSVGLPQFNVRGLLSQGSVAGQDKSVPIYLDGVAIGSALGLSFDLPDLERIEVLRGPQGTLFGRNSTGGAIGIYTREPTGELHASQTVTVGNRSNLRSITQLETPSFGPFSARFSYTHSTIDGPIRNLGAGTVWDRTVEGKGRVASPSRLGDEKYDAVFAALKFDNGGSFTTTYKFDWLDKDFTPEANVLVAFTPENGLGDFFGGIVRDMFDASGGTTYSPSHRPRAVNNDFQTPGHQKVEGHNLTSIWHATDNITVKNILAYRKSFIYANSQISGVGGLRVTPGAATGLELVYGLPAGSLAGAVGSPFLVYEAQVQNRAKQFSDELQLNYDSDPLTLTVGGLYYWQKGTEGAAGENARLAQFTPYPGFVVPMAPRDVNFNTGKSWAGYGQAEIHVATGLDIVGGIRFTKDKKTGDNVVAGVSRTFRYKDDETTYMLGANYRFDDNIMGFVKFSTGYVSGGVVSQISFKPEKVKSYEVGVKADLLDRRLRLNVAAFIADYTDLQSVQSGIFIDRPELGLVVLTEGDRKAKGLEVEATVAPMQGLTLNGSFGYTHLGEIRNLNPLLAAIGATAPTYRSKYTANLAAQYETPPLFGEARLSMRVDGAYRSKKRLFGNAASTPAYEAFQFSPGGWLINSRLALKDIAVGPGSLELAAWVRNLTDKQRPDYGINFVFAGAVNFEPARTYGVDAVLRF